MSKQMIFLYTCMIMNKETQGYDVYPFGYVIETWWVLADIITAAPLKYSTESTYITVFVFDSRSFIDYFTLMISLLACSIARTHYASHNLILDRTFAQTNSFFCSTHSISLALIVVYMRENMKCTWYETCVHDWNLVTPKLSLVLQCGTLVLVL